MHQNGRIPTFANFEKFGKRYVTDAPIPEYYQISTPRGSEDLHFDSRSNDLPVQSEPNGSAKIIEMTFSACRQKIHLKQMTSGKEYWSTSTLNRLIPLNQISELLVSRPQKLKRLIVRMVLLHV